MMRRDEGVLRRRTESEVQEARREDRLKCTASTVFIEQEIHQGKILKRVGVVGMYYLPAGIVVSVFSVGAPLPEFRYPVLDLICCRPAESRPSLALDTDSCRRRILANRPSIQCKFLVLDASARTTSTCNGLGLSITIAKGTSRSPLFVQLYPLSL